MPVLVRSSDIVSSCEFSSPRSCRRQHRQRPSKQQNRPSNPRLLPSFPMTTFIRVILSSTSMVHPLEYTSIGGESFVVEVRHRRARSVKYSSRMVIPLHFVVSLRFPIHVFAARTMAFSYVVRFKSSDVLFTTLTNSQRSRNSEGKNTGPAHTSSVRSSRSSSPDL
jgi:hypothetical protein